MESKTRSEILLDEKVDQIDDINFDKIYDIGEVASKELDTFDNEIIIKDLPETDANQEEKENDITFSMEVDTNEFLDNFEIGRDSDIKAKQKTKLAHKPLIFAFTSIMALLCILFVYNMFVINSLEFSAGRAQAMAEASFVTNANTENDYITFDNSNTLEIEDYSKITQESSSGTNWFDSVVKGVSQMFGGNY